MRDNDSVDERIAETARGLYHAPPPTPSEEMWSDIQSRLDAGSDSMLPIGRRESRISGLTWWIGIAAALAIGLGVGRMSLTPTRAGEGGAQVAAVPSGAPSQADRSSLPYVVATQGHLDDAESLLMTVKADRGSSAPEVQTGTRARTLLSRTRLLMETPAAATPEMKALLEDLELMLMQVVVMADTEDPQEARILDQGLAEGDLLLRMRSVNWTRTSPARGL